MAVESHGSKRLNILKKTMFEYNLHTRDVSEVLQSFDEVEQWKLIAINPF